MEERSESVEKLKSVILVNVPSKRTWLSHIPKNKIV